MTFVIPALVTDAGQLAIGIEPVVVQTMAAICKHADETPKVNPPTTRAGTKQTMLIALLRVPEGATMGAIIAATGWPIPRAARCRGPWAKSWGWL